MFLQSATVVTTKPGIVIHCGFPKKFPVGFYNFFFVLQHKLVTHTEFWWSHELEDPIKKKKHRKISRESMVIVGGGGGVSDLADQVISSPLYKNLCVYKMLLKWRWGYICQFYVPVVAGVWVCVWRPVWLITCCCWRWAPAGEGADILTVVDWTAGYDYTTQTERERIQLMQSNTSTDLLYIQSFKHL